MCLAPSAGVFMTVDRSIRPRRRSFHPCGVETSPSTPVSAIHVLTSKQLIVHEVGKRNDCCHRFTPPLDIDALPLSIYQSDNVCQAPLYIGNRKRQRIRASWALAEFGLPLLLCFLPILSLKPLNDRFHIFFTALFVRLCRFGKTKAHSFDLVLSLICNHLRAPPLSDH